MDESSGEMCFRTVAEILSGPEAVEESSLEIAFATSAGVIRKLQRVSLEREGNSGRGVPVELREQLEEKDLASSSALSLEEERMEVP